MDFTVKIVPHTLHFKRPAGTSRGVYHDHNIWYVLVTSTENPEQWGIGECAPLFDLSCDYNNDYEQNLELFCKQLQQTGQLDREALRPYPSILFGLETALQHFNQNSFQLWNTPFSQGKAGIPINGLIWMGDYAYMKEQIEAKMQAGYRCIKLKIGAIDFDKELELLQHIRKQFSAEDIELRVDANGAFSAENAMERLQRLSELELHSIEQPIKAGQWDEMARLTANTPLPIALDEELIGVNNIDKKRELLETIRPQYIILKPTLHGGMMGSREWIEIAESIDIQWWITSALESNIGLNAVAQFASTFTNPLPQGLGTGGLYTNNIDMSLTIREDCLWMDQSGVFPKKSDF